MNISVNRSHSGFRLLKGAALFCAVLIAATAQAEQVINTAAGTTLIFGALSTFFVSYQKNLGTQLQRVSSNSSFSVGI